jgi:ParB family chromosome partitioning protein
MGRRGNLLTGSGAAAAGRAQAKQATEWVARESAERRTLPLSAICSRPGGDTRPLNVGHVIELAESIAAVGLVEPLAVDNGGRLLAGAHRLAALNLLAESEPDARVNAWLVVAGMEPGRRVTPVVADRMERLRALAPLEVRDIPILMFPFDATADPARALAIETTENTQRKAYTKEEVLSLVERLRAAGYVERDGRPRAGERALRPALSVILRKSPNTVRRLLGVLNDVNKTCPPGHVSELERARLSLRASIARYRRVAAASLRSKEAGKEVLSTLETLERLLSTGK